MNVILAFSGFFLVHDAEALLYEHFTGLDQLQAASVHYRIAISPHAGRKALTLYSVPPMEERSNIPPAGQDGGLSDFMGLHWKSNWW
jgi:hypothetical protein